ncbi:MAG: Cache domain [Candidatus Petromonas sp.]|nr:Cache domain [Candidatus Petromonas sp.]
MMVFSRKGVPTISLQFTILLSIFALIPIVIICVLSYRMNDIQLTSTSIRLAEKAVSQVADNIGTLMQSAENTASVLSKDANLQKAHNDFSREASLSTAIDHYIRLNKLFTYLNLSSNFYNIRVYLPDYDRITCEEYSIFGISKLDDSKIPITMKTEGQESGWYGPYEFTRISEKKTIFTYYHKLFSYERYSKDNSLICIDISVERLKEILLQDLNIESVYFLIDSNGKIILSSIPDSKINSAIYKIANLIDENENNLVTIPGKGLCYYRRVPVGNSGWQLIGVIPMNQFRENNKIILLKLRT